MTRTPKPIPKRQNQRKIWTLVAITATGLFCLQALLAIPRLSATIDEPVHLSSGYSYLETRDFRMNPEHPPLVKLIAALPLLGLRPKIDTSSQDWTAAAEYPFGANFLYSSDADRLLFWGRLPMIALAAVGCWVTFLWARDLYGAAAGAFGAALYSFCPNLLAHGMLITTDVPLGTFTVLTLYLFWRQIAKPSWRRNVLTGLALGAAMASKYSGALLPILIVTLVVVRAFLQKDVKRAAIEGIQNLGIMAAACLFVIETAYLVSASPSLYFRNIALVNANHSAGYESYMLGQLKPNGWWYYFLVAFVAKATLPMLVFLAIAAFTAVKRLTNPWGEIILLAGIGTFFIATSIGADNIGVRYLLPIFPLLYIWGSRIVPAFWKNALGRSVLFVLLGWQVWAAISSFPEYIPYFNETVGGPKRGPDILDDSNVDWGESLKEAAAYVRAKQIDKVILCPFWQFDNPAYYGLNSTIRAPKQLVFKNPESGTYIISGHSIAWMKAVDAAWRNYQPIDRIGGMWVYRF